MAYASVDGRHTGLDEAGDEDARAGGPVPTTEMCLTAVRSYVGRTVDAGGYPGSEGYRRIAGQHGWPSAEAVVARLGSWPGALLAAGFDRPRRRAAAFVSRQDCVAAVAAYAAEAATRGEHPGLVGYERVAPYRRWPSRTTVTARLGPWTRALTEAGVRPTAHRRPDRADCLAALTAYVAEMTEAGLYPAVRDYRGVAPHRGWPRSSVIVDHLGPWPSALRTAGFTGPTRSGRPNVSRDDCIAALRSYVEEATLAGRHPGVVGYDAAYRERGWPQRQSTVMARFGSWSAALAAAGFVDPRHQREHRVGRGDCLLAVRSYLAEMSDTGVSPSLAGYGKLARTRGWPAVATVLARLGSWRQAVRLAESPEPDCLVPVGSL